MKLPNIQYQQRKPLAKVDPSMFVALGRAQAQTSEAIGSTGKAIGSAVQDVYDRESVSQMQDAYLNYSEQMDRYSQQQTSYSTNDDSGEREGSWISGTQRFDNYERELRDSLNKKLTSPLARRLFAEKANVQNVQNKKINNAQLGSWQKEHEIAGVHTRLNRQVDNKRFGDARATVVEAMTVGTISEVQAGKQVEAINYEELNHNWSVGVDLIATPEDAIKYRKEVEASNLKGPDINRHLAAVDDNLINNFQAKMNNVILEAEVVNGSKADGYAAGRTYLDSVMRTKAGKLGGDDKFKEMVVSTSNTILNRYKIAVVKQTTESARIKRMNDLAEGNIIAGPKLNVVEYDDAFNVNVMNYQVNGKTGYTKDFNNPNPNQRAIKDSEFLENKDGSMSKFIGYSAAGGHMPKTGAAILDAGILYGSSQQGVQAVNAISAMYRNSPTVLNRGNENKDFADVATYVEMSGGAQGGAENALQLFRKRKAMSKEIADGYIGTRKDNNEFFDDNVDAAIDAQFGEKDKAWYDLITNTSAAMSAGFKVRARMAMKHYLPAYEGDKGRALNAALISLKTSYSGTSANGDYSMMLNSPESRVPNGNVNSGKWIPQQLETDVKQNFGEDIDMDNIYIEAVDRFDVNDPAYQVYQKTDDGMVRSLGVTKFDYTLSKEYLDNQAELKTEQEANKRIAENARLREQWELDNPPSTRDRTRYSRAARINPYGRGTELTGAEKAIVGFARGISAQAEAAKVAKAVTKPIREKRLKEKAEAAASRSRKTGRGLN